MAECEIRMAAGESGRRSANQDCGVAECVSASRSNARVCSGSPLGNEGTPKKSLVNSSRIKFRNPNISIATKHKINASKNR